jgi:hypothetical protein
MSHQGTVVAAMTQTAEGTEYARGSIPTQTADCTAMAGRPGWTASTTRDDEARSARDGSRDDGLVQTRDHADRGADGRREVMFAAQRTDRLVQGLP